MLVRSLFLLSLLSPALSRYLPPRDQEQASQTEIKRIQSLALAQYQERYASSNGTCNATNLIVRREFGSLAPAERKSYTDAVLCLQSLPSRSPASLVPGARSRYDDFVGAHINQTNNIHYTGNFLAWHRYFVHTYENSLRTECNYTGSQPYWDWPLYSSSPQTSPIFNGDEFSMGGNGELIPDHPGITISPPPLPGRDPGGDSLYLPPGLGGGCVKTGPFSNMTVNLGPVQEPNTPAGPDNGLGYNPRCLKRDVGPDVAQEWTNSTAVISLLEEPDIESFEMNMEGVPGSGQFGVHAGGHFTIAGDPGSDLYTSPGDPVFFLHHAQIDRIWWMWQGMDISRIDAISGTASFLNDPPTANTTLDTKLDLGFAGGETVSMKDLMDTTAGPFCYVYA